VRRGEGRQGKGRINKGNSWSAKGGKGRGMEGWWERMKGEGREGSCCKHLWCSVPKI